MYAYTQNNSIMFVDPSGYFPDYLIDIPLFAIGVKEFIDNPSWSKVGWLALDFVLTLLPILPALSGARHLNKVDDGLDAIKAVNSVDSFTDAGNVIRRANQADFTADTWKTINSLDNVNGFTKSSMSTGREIHKGFMLGPGKEHFISGVGRMDYFDETAGIIYELKPYNLNGVRSGIRQLNRYNDLLGGGYKTVLILY